MYGMVMLFGAAFPLAPLVAMICNLVDIRIDAHRLLWENRRYIAQRAEDIGTIVGHFPKKYLCNW